MSTLRSRNMVVAGALAILAALLTILYVGKAKGTPAASAQSESTALVATADIAIGTPGATILKDHLAAPRAVPVGGIVPDALQTTAQLSKLVTTSPIYKGEQLTALRFETGAAEGLRAQLQGTLRAIQVAGDQNQLLAGTLRDGDRVDVVASVVDPKNPQNHLTRIVLRNILVLQAPTTKTTSGPSSTTQTSATLQVSDTQAQKLFFVVKDADWTLMLRPVVNPADDPSTVDTAESVVGGGA